MEDIIHALAASTVSALKTALLSRTELHQLVRYHLRTRWKRVAQRFVFVGDTMYSCPSRKELREIVDGFAPSAPRYTSNTADCDDFAWLFKAYACSLGSKNRKPAAYAIGVIWRTTNDAARTGHAYNWAITDRHEVLVIDPQSREIREFNQTDVNIDLACC